MTIADDVTRVPITSQMRPIALGKMFAPTDADFPAEVKAAVELVRNMPAKLAAMEAEGAKHSDPYYAVFKNRLGEVVAAVYSKGGLMVRDNGLDTSEIQQKIKSMAAGPALAKETVAWLAKQLGPDVKVEYPGATQATKPASSAQSRTSLQRQMDLLAINQKA